MKIIGLTGGIGSGKSTVSRFLAELGAVIVDADKVGHEALQDAGIRRGIIAAFGEQVLTPGGEVDRNRLGKIVFADMAALSRLNRITHPKMLDMVLARFEDCRRRGVAVVVLEAPLLVEAGWGSMVDEVWVTSAPEPTVLRRLQERSGLSAAESLARIRAQLPAEERRKHADVIINTDCSLEELRDRVRELWRKTTEGTGNPDKG